MKKADFNQLLKVFHRQKPDRPVLFEFFLNEEIYERVTGKAFKNLSGEEELNVRLQTSLALGYDYLNVLVGNFEFNKQHRPSQKSVSMNGNAQIKTKEDFERYPWPKISEMHKDVLDMKWAMQDYEGLKLIVYGPGGILENVTDILGYDNMCYMLYDEEELVGDIFNKVGSLLLEYYKEVIDYDSVGAVIYNDDWGFKGSTLVAPSTLRKHIFPWVKQIVDLAHSRNKPIMLHSCGKLDDIMQDIIELGFDAKHSFEDNILPVEEFYKKWIDQIAIIGGIDVDFICRSAPEEVFKRSSNMLKIAEEKGGYALGTGNSVPGYVPYDNYRAMIKAAGFETEGYIMVKMPIALQLYSVRDELYDDFEGTLRKVKEMGYEGVEFAGLYGRNVTEVKSLLSELNLIAVSAHVGFEEMMSDSEKVMEAYAQLGCQYIVLPYVTEEYHPDAEAFPKMIEAIKVLGQTAKEKGLTLLYHNHDFEFKKVNGEYGLDVLYSSVSKDLLQTELDTCWVNVAGEDPVGYIKKYSGRTPVVHLKDFVMKDRNKPAHLYELIGIESDEADNGSEENFGFRPVGYGVQDIPAIIEAATASGTKWLVVEQDDPTPGKTPLECAQMSLNFLKNL